MNENIFSVFLCEQKIPEIKIIAEIISKSEKLIFYEVMHKIINNYGFIMENINEEKANEIINLFKNYNINSKKINIKDIPEINQVLEIKNLELNDNLIKYKIKEDFFEENISNLSIIAYAPIKTETNKIIKTTEGPSAQEKAIRAGIMLTTGLPIGLGKSKEISKEIKEYQTDLYLDLIFLNKTHLRLNANNFDFSCLKENKTYSSNINIKNLYMKLINLNPNALKNYAILDILQGKMSLTFNYENFKSLEKEEKRLLLCLSLLNFI